MRSVFLVPLVLAAASPVHAEDTRNDADQAAVAILESARSYVPAKATERKAPSYPRNELTSGREGWVEVGYCIDENGAPQNVQVLDSTGNSRFERAAISSVGNWKFEPALVGGKPSWQSNNKTLITFAIDASQRGARREVARKYKKLGELIDDNNLAEADAFFLDLIENERLNLYELAMIWSQRVRYQAKRGDFLKLDLALHRATASDGQWTEEENYQRLLEIRVKVEIQLGNYAKALSAYRALKRVLGEDAPQVTALQPAIDSVRSYLDGNDVLESAAEIRAKGGCYGCDDSYWFIPARRTIAFREIDGALTSIDVRCTHKRYESAVSEEVEWRIPDSWGSCSIEVHGKPGTTFKILALPDA
ncbi:MAG: energy transducer TonB [Gammaproteobacteria bacterium]|nr:energy transducer TonB [Gammaproteobacteria bacterium]NNF48810.1 energy transducer TonB [Woeseiaceae bacterium]MBT8093828.1 energy transducer TonB [Gammaproteobacteria bacterium]MBT8105912.1 energy transducer TonB [Gammaproteobacteria bacterium]NNK25926.1 energy transducer TonB [Woeseiaceae bacterium]